MKKIFYLLLLFFLTPKIISAQSSNYLETKVVNIPIQENRQVLGHQVTYQKLELQITKGDQSGSTITIENGLLPVSDPQIYHLGDRLLVAADTDLDGQPVYQIVDYIRRPALLLIFVLFIILTLIIGRLRGFSSLLAMLFSFFIIFIFILPQILAGHPPLLITLFGSLFIIPVSFFLAHGFNRKTLIAVIATLFSLFLTGLLAQYFIQLAHLTGFSTEEAAFLQNATFGTINIRGLILSGIIIASLGVLDDITISQSAIIEQLKIANHHQSKKQLFARAMSIGRDHIASMVNTLVLVYAGAALPLLLLFVNNTHPFLEIINYELIAEEIIRTLVGSIGLIAAVPITTFLALHFPSKH